MSEPVGAVGGAEVVPVGGRPVRHAVHGDGEPLVLLHGGLFGITGWDDHPARLAEQGFRVHVPERRGHGASPDTGEPLSYADMAAETVAYLDAVVGGPAPLVGWSDGALVALLVALDRPDLVSRLVLVGQYLTPDGKAEDGTEDMLRDPGMVAVLRDEYAREQPDGDFGDFFARTTAMWDAGAGIELSRLTTVTAPTLVLQGDRDDVRVEHSLAVVRSLAHARLAVLPGTHLLPLEQPELVRSVVVRFLRGGLGDQPGGLG